MKYLVELYWIMNGTSSPVIICDTRKQAEKYIEKKMKNKQYNGSGYYRIQEIPHITEGEKENE